MFQAHVGDRRMISLPPEVTEKGGQFVLPDEDAARQFLLSLCWPGGEPFCPRCSHKKVYSLSGNRMRCASCKYTFQPFSGRWINNGGLSCAEWIGAAAMFAEEKTVHQMSAALRLSYNTVYKALTTMRFAIVANALDSSQFLSPETGLSNYLKGNRLTGMAKEMRMDTIPVYGIIRQGGLAFIDIVPGINAETIFHFHLNFHLGLVRSGNLVYTDKYKGYDSLIFCGNDSLPYACIKRTDKPLLIDEFRSGFWQFARNRIKKFRGISCQRFPLYLKELEFRYNNRDRSVLGLLCSHLCGLVQDPKN